jgi:hypothetical protein
LPPVLVMIFVFSAPLRAGPDNGLSTTPGCDGRLGKERMAMKASFIQTVREAEGEIKRLRDKIREPGERDVGGLSDAIERLEAKKVQAEAKLAELKRGEGGALEDLKAEFEKAYSALKAACEDIRSL